MMDETSMTIDWAFNLKVFVKAYQDLGYPTHLEDWNVRIHAGEIRLDNSISKTTTAFIVNDGILTVEIHPWNPEIADPKSYNIDLLQTSGGWRNWILDPVRSPPPEGVAFLNHLAQMGYFPVHIPGEFHDDD